MGTSIASARVDADLSAKNEMSCISATHVGSLAKRRRRTLGASGVRRTQTEGARRMRSEEESRVPECAGALASLPRPWRTTATWCCFFTRLSSAPSSTLRKSSSQSPTYDRVAPASTAEAGLHSASISQRLDLYPLHAPGSGFPRAWCGTRCPCFAHPIVICRARRCTAPSC